MSLYKHHFTPSRVGNASRCILPLYESNTFRDSGNIPTKFSQELRMSLGVQKAKIRNSLKGPKFVPPSKVPIQKTPKTLGAPARCLDAPDVRVSKQIIAIVGKYMAIALSNCIYLWTEEDGCKTICEVDEGVIITSLNWFEDTHIIFGTSRGYVHVIEKTNNNFLTWKVVRKMLCDQSSEEGILSLAFSNKMPFLFSTKSNGNISVSNLSVQDFHVQQLKTTTSVSLDKIHLHLSKILTGFNKEAVFIWILPDLNLTSSDIKGVKRITLPLKGATSLAWIKKNVFVLAYENGDISFHKINFYTGDIKEINIVKNQGSGIKMLFFSCTKKQLCIAYDNVGPDANRIKICDLKVFDFKYYLYFDKIIENMTSVFSMICFNKTQLITISTDEVLKIHDIWEEQKKTHYYSPLWNGIR